MINIDIKNVLHVTFFSLSLLQYSSGDEFEDKMDQFKASADALRLYVADENSRLAAKYDRNLKIEEKELASIQEKITSMTDVYSTYYPGDFVYLMPIYGKIQSHESDIILSECLYSQIQSEVTHISRIAIHGIFDKIEAGKIIKKRIRLLLSVFPVSEVSFQSESFGLVSILNAYASFDEDLTKELLLKSIDGLETSAQLPILVFLSNRGDEVSKNRLALYDQSKVKKLEIVCNATRREKIKTPEKKGGAAPISK